LGYINSYHASYFFFKTGTFFSFSILVFHVRRMVSGMGLGPPWVNFKSFWLIEAHAIKASPAIWNQPYGQASYAIGDIARQ